ncbi:sensor histidine kinase [Roseateles sp. DAIF2]|uniref:sensor histidine kinase n=1 Tax=Roseateles sp. DAIF2 TaxID=2714952 RepID=UPI0018A2C6B6|nr:ATP-binding protein [Roseateles sp. DAIF2]QPF75066.1 sensor histidine kinase [Roseateles sp. DAIF2]
MDPEQADAGWLDAQVDELYTLLGCQQVQQGVQGLESLEQRLGADLPRLRCLRAWIQLRQAQPIETARLAELLALGESGAAARGLPASEHLLLSAQALHRQGLSVQAARDGSAALAAFEQQGRRPAMCIAANQMLSQLIAIGDLVEVGRLLPLLEQRIGGLFDWSDTLLGVAHACVAYGRAEAGDEAARRECIERYLRLYEHAARPGLGMLRRLVGTNLAINCAMGGDPEQALRVLGELEAEADEVPLSLLNLMLAWCAYAQARIELLGEAPQRAAPHLNQALALEQDSQRSANLRIKVHEALAELAFRDGRVADGRQQMRERQAVQEQVIEQIRQRHQSGLQALLREAELSAELQHRNRQLQEANEEMERRVRERTAELGRAREALLQHEQRQAISRLLMGVAHQLNTPLGNAALGAGALAGLAQGLRDKALGPLRRQELVEGLEQAVQAADVVAAAVRSSHALLARFAELGLHERLHENRRVNLAALLREQAQQAAPEWAGGGAGLTLALDEDIEWCGAVEALGHVVQHLLRNALRHGHEAGEATRGFLRLRRALPQPGLCIEVADQGPGMDEATRAQAFTPFARRLPTEGGLGLALVRNLVEGLMRGSIELLPQQPHGLLVRLTLPDGRAGLPAATAAGALLNRGR